MTNREYYFDHISNTTLAGMLDSMGYCCPVAMIMENPDVECTHLGCFECLEKWLGEEKTDVT